MNVLPSTQNAEPQSAVRWKTVFLLFAAYLAIEIVLALTVFPLDSPVFYRHDLRQSLVATVVYWSCEEGISLLRYPYPVYGPPWTVPLEFPAFQVCSTLLARTGWVSIYAACRLVNMGFFLLSACFLLALCRLLLGERHHVYYILGVYLLLPFNLYWSRSIMIDFTSLALALVYGYALLYCLTKGGSVWLALIAVVAGCLACMVKPIAVCALNLLILGWLGWATLGDRKSSQGFVSTLWQQRWKFVLCCSVMAVPVVATVAWTRASSEVAEESPAMQGPAGNIYVTTRSVGFRLGIWSGGLDLSKWMLLFRNIGVCFSPPMLLLVAVAVWLEDYERPLRLLLQISLLVMLIVTLTFFNSFGRNDYDFIHLTPLVAIVTGLAMERVFVRVQRRRGSAWARCVVGAFVLSAYVILYCGYVSYMERKGDIAHQWRIIAVGRLVQEATKPDCILATEDYVAKATIPLACRRKALALPACEALLADESLRARTALFITAFPKSPLLRHFPDARPIGRLGEIAVFATGTCDDPPVITEELMKKHGVTPMTTMP